MVDGNPPWRPAPLLRVSLALHVMAVCSLLIWPGRWPWALAVLLINHLVLMATGLWPRSHWLGENWTQLPQAAAARNEFALTIDDGPDPAVTPQVLTILDRFGASATFFCIGDKAQRHPDLCREIVRRGHAIENHSQRHRHTFSVTGLRGMRLEIQAAQETLTSICGQRPLFFRAPAGLRNPFLDHALHALGLRLASWTVRGFDTRQSDAQRVASKLIRGLRPGAIVLLHDGNAARTALGVPVILDALPVLLEAAAARGLRTVTLRQAFS